MTLCFTAVSTGILNNLTASPSQLLLQPIIELKIKCWNNISASHLKVGGLVYSKFCLVVN